MDDAEPALMKLSPTKAVSVDSGGMIRSKTFADMRGISEPNNTSSSRLSGGGDRLSVDRREKLESGSRDINDKLAALNENWMSIKKNDLETIKEVKPKEPIAAKVYTGRNPPSTVKPTSMTASSVVSPHAKDTPHTAKSKVSTVSNANAIGQRPRGNSGTIHNPTPGQMKSPSASHNTTSNQLSSSQVGGFDIHKAFEELDNIKTKMSSTKQRTTQGKKSLAPQSEHGGEDTSAHHNEEHSENRAQAALKRTLHATAATAALTAKKPLTATAKHQNHLNHEKVKKDLQSVEDAFKAAFKRVQDFERDTGIPVKLTDMNREYNKLIETLKEHMHKAG